MKNTFIIYIALGLFASCDEKQTSKDKSINEQNEATSLTTNNSDSKTDSIGETDETVPLIDSLQNPKKEKWKVNEEVMQHLKEGQLLVTYFYDSGDEDYLSLVNELSTINNKIIASSTMKGEVHEAFNQWLNPHLELTKDLKNARNIDAAYKVVESLLMSYSVFHRNFQQH